MDSGSDKRAPRGFAGLTDLIPDEPVSTPRSEPTPESPPPPIKESPRSSGEAPPRQTSVDQLPDPPAAPKGSFPWGWIVAGVIGFLIVIGNLDHGSSGGGTVAPGNYAPGPAASTANPRDFSPPPTVELPATTWVETPPPPARDRVLTRNELRYCLSEQVRLEAMEPMVDSSNGSQVDLFNRHVDDYNSRCGSFRYEEGMLESVRREVAEQHARLWVEGTERISQSFSPAVSAPVETETEPLNAQQLQGSDTAEAEYLSVPDAGGGVEPYEPGNPERPTADAKVTPPTAMDMTVEERESLESACASAKYTQGPAAYSKCINRQLSALESSPRRHELSGLTMEERQSLESACSSAKYTQGPAAYNQCINRQLLGLASAPRGHDLSDLNTEERQSLESACSSAKYTQGPAAYNQCINRQLRGLASAPRGQDLSGLTKEERQSLESACSSAKYTQGPAAYNQCIDRQVSALATVPRGQDLSGLNTEERRSLESACSSAKYTQGPAAYNDCITRQLSALATAPRGYDLSDLNSADRRSLDTACSSAKYTQGPAEYNRCISRWMSPPRE